MSRQARLHVSGGFYYLSQRCRSGERLFSNAEDYAKFSEFLGKALKPLKMRIHGYCWLPNEFHLLVEVGEFPVGKLMQRLANHLTYRIHGPRSAPTLFPERHHQVLIDHEEYLRKALRYIHWLSVDAGTQKQLNGYEWSSHLGYLGVMQAPCLTTYVALGQFNRHTERARRAYAVFMSVQPPENELRMFEARPGNDPRVLGGSLFIRRLGLGLKIPSNMTLETMTKNIAQRMGLDPDQIRSRSQCGHLPLARAAIAWHAIERGITNLAGAARFFGCRRWSLHKVIANNCEAHPEWFDLWKLPGVGPIAPMSSVMTVEDVPHAAESDDDDAHVEPDIGSDIESNIEPEGNDWPPHEPPQRLQGLARVH